MKELKYRAWDKLNNQMLEVLQISFNDRGLPYIRVGIVGRNHNNDYNLRMYDMNSCSLQAFITKIKKRYMRVILSAADILRELKQ